MMRNRDTATRRRFLLAGATAGTALLAGCNASSSESGTNGTNATGGTNTAGASTGTNATNGTGSANGTASGERPEISEFRGSSPLVADRPEPGGTSIADLPDLSGELTLYIGGGEGGLYEQLADLLQKYYPDFSVNIRFTAANQVLTEGKAGQVRADVFWANDAGSLGAIGDAGLAAKLPSSITKPVPKRFRTKRWVGVAGRARAIPYNTEQFSKSDVPNDITAFTESKNLDATMGWAPTYPAFQTFVTAMRLRRGKKKTKQWLNGMQKRTAGMETYKNEYLVSNAVADGALGAGIANHYYTIRVISARENAPIGLAFTKNDAGALVNVAGAEVMKAAEKPKLARNFVRHLLSAEAQEFLATRSFAYPMIEGVKPVGPLPSIRKLNPPKVDLTKLSDRQPTIRLLRETGVL